MIIYDYFSSVFCIVPKKVENARINFSISPYCTLLFSRKENFKFFGSSFITCFLQWRGWLHYQCVKISELNTTLDIYLLLKTAIKARCKVCSNLTKFTSTIDFRLLVSFLLTLNTFHTLLYCYYSYFEKVNVG